MTIIIIIIIIINTAEALNNKNTTGTIASGKVTAVRYCTRKNKDTPQFTSAGRETAGRRGASKRNAVVGLEGQQRQPWCP